MSVEPATVGVDPGSLERAYLASLQSGESGEITTYETLVEQYGKENVDNAIANLGDQETVRAMKAQIEARDFTEAEQELAFASLDADLAASERPTTTDAQDAVSALLLGNIRAMNEELAEEGAASADGKQAAKGGKSGGTGNWLVLMAQAMAKIAGDHLAKSLEYAEQIGTLNGGDLSGIEGFEPVDGESDEAAQARATTFLQAKMQAETQLFKMVFEAASTLIKTAGEGFSTMARKQ